MSSAEARGRYSPAGISARNRELLAELTRAFSGPFTAREAASLLRLDLETARRQLTYLTSRGWLARVRRGIYITVPLEAPYPSDWREDPWVAASKLFSPCYVGGWSACEHWGLTEQLFRTLVVFTGRRVHRRQTEIQGTPVRLKTINPEGMFGTRLVWRARARIQVSDPARTMVDILADPALGGGIRHITDVLGNYFLHTERDDDLLIKYADKLGNKAVFKRLGYLIETLRVTAPTLLQGCRRRISLGVVRLDPTLPRSGHIVSRWNILANVPSIAQS